MPKIADLNSPAAQLLDSYDQLMAKWRNVEQTWNDAQSRHVETEYLQEIRPRMQMALDALQRVDEFLAKAQRACESYE